MPLHLRFRDLDTNPRKLVPGLIILCAILVGGPILLKEVERRYGSQGPEIQYQTPEDDVRHTVESFGDVLKNVPLSAEPAITSQTIEENYLEYLTPQLRDQWTRNPNQALGRLTSSPWPERIDVETITKTTDETFGEAYLVKANIVYMTSEEMAHGGDAGRDSVTFTLVPKLWSSRMPQGWAISNVQLERK